MHGSSISAPNALPASSRPVDAGVRPAAPRAGRDLTLWASAVYVATAGSAAWLAGSQVLAICALGFWHYVLYALAYRYGAVPLPVFKRDAVLMKIVALLALASAYFAAPLDVWSLAVVVAGFLLNTLAAAALGSDRTYYGYEVADLPRLRVTRFPYSVVAHPMLIGNMLAYGGMLLNAEFRAQWWPLAGAHVVLNLALLAMERCVTPLRRSAVGTRRPARGWSWPRWLGLSAAGAALAAGTAALTHQASAPLAALLGALAMSYAYTMYCAYTRTGTPPVDRDSAATENAPCSTPPN